VERQFDFKHLKQEADFLEVLAHYDAKTVGRGVSRAILCPFHNDKTPSCKVNLGRKIFHCFGCGAHGNVLDFVRMKEGLPEDDLRAAARVLAEICGLPLRSPADGPGKRARRPEKAGRGSKTMKEPSDTTTPVYEAPTASEEGSTAPAENVPLTDDFIARFKAKLELYHPSFEARGVSPLAAQHFELGYCPADAKSPSENEVSRFMHLRAPERGAEWW
jgi:DNA primase